MRRHARAVWLAFRIAFHWLSTPLRRIIPRRRRSKVIGEIELRFDSEAEAMAWINNELNQIRLERIANMRGWERQTKFFTKLQAMNVVIQLALPTVLSSGWWGVGNYVCVLFVYSVQTITIFNFTAHRDQLLTDLENDPDAEVWWYDAWTKGAKA